MQLKAATKADLFRLNRIAIERGYNRTINIDVLEAQPDDLTAVVQMSMPHSHAGGIKVDPHIRAVWIIQNHNVEIADQIVPMMVTLDCDWDEFEKLPTIDTQEITNA